MEAAAAAGSPHPGSHRGLHRHFSLMSLLPKPLLQHRSLSSDADNHHRRRGQEDGEHRREQQNQQHQQHRLQRLNALQSSLVSAWQPFELGDRRVSVVFAAGHVTTALLGFGA